MKRRRARERELTPTNGRLEAPRRLRDKLDRTRVNWLVPFSCLHVAGQARRFVPRIDRYTKGWGGGGQSVGPVVKRNRSLINGLNEPRRFGDYVVTSTERERESFLRAYQKQKPSPINRAMIATHEYKAEKPTRVARAKRRSVKCKKSHRAAANTEVSSLLFLRRGKGKCKIIV